MTFKLLAILLAFVAVSCSSGNAKKNNSDIKDMPSRHVASLPYFKRIVLNGAFEVYYEQSDSLSVEVRGTKAVERNVVVKVENETLDISLSNKDLLRLNRTRAATVYISSPDLVGVVMRGAGDFEAKGTIDTDTLDIQLLGAGNIEFDNILCDNAYFYLRGAGNIDVDNITSQNTEIQLMGVGQADVNFVNSGNLKCELKGVGNIDVEGDVRTFTKKVSGTGSIDTDELKVGGAKGK